MTLNKTLVVFVASWLLFKITPVINNSGEFYSAGIKNISDWIFNASSSIVFLVFWLLYWMIAYFIERKSFILNLLSGSIFGISYALFEFPISLLDSARNDLYKALIPYLISLIFLEIGHILLLKKAQISQSQS